MSRVKCHHKGFVFFLIITSLAGALSKKHNQKQEEVANRTEWLIPSGTVPQSEPTQCVVVLRGTRYSQQKKKRKKPSDPRVYERLKNLSANQSQMSPPKTKKNLKQKHTEPAKHNLLQNWNVAAICPNTIKQMFITRAKYFPSATSSGRLPVEKMHRLKGSRRSCWYGRIPYHREAWWNCRGGCA